MNDRQPPRLPEPARVCPKCFTTQVRVGTSGAVAVYPTRCFHCGAQQGGQSTGTSLPGAGDRSAGSTRTDSR